MIENETVGEVATAKPQAGANSIQDKRARFMRADAHGSKRRKSKLESQHRLKAQESARPGGSPSRLPASRWRRRRDAEGGKGLALSQLRRISCKKRFPATGPTSGLWSSRRSQ